MSDEELIARLRKADEYEPLGHDGWEAADRIEELVKEKRWIMEERDRTFALMLARAERLEEALLWCSGSADFNEGGFAREGWLKVCAPLLKGESHD